MMYIEEWAKTHIKNQSQVTNTMFPAKYGSLALYDEDMGKRFLMDREKLKFYKIDVWTLIGIPEKEYGSLSYHEYFSYMMICLIELNQPIKIKCFCGIFHLIN